MVPPIAKHFLITIIQFAGVVLGILTLLFFLQRLTGDPAAVLVGHNATPEVLAAVRDEMGLNDPLPLQYLTFLSKTLQLDFGESNRFQRPALELVLTRLPNSLLLSFSALGLALLVGIPLGVYAALRHRQADGTAINLIAGMLQAVPSFWLGLILLLIFSVNLGWVGSVANMEDDLLKRMALPTITLAAFYIARLIRLVRSSLLEELNQDYVLTARSKGLSTRQVIFGHALKNALIPVIALVSLDLSFMIGGSIIVENLYSYSGIGDQMVKAIFNRDYALVQASMFVIVVFVVLINMAANRLYSIADPRLRA